METWWTLAADKIVNEHACVYDLVARVCALLQSEVEQVLYTVGFVAAVSTTLTSPM